MAQSVFGAGYLAAVPSGVTTPTPSVFAALQDVSVDFSFDQKALYGSNQFALEYARGKGKIELKASTGRIDPVLFNSVFFGMGTTTGEILSAIAEAGTVPAVSGPYTITSANAANWLVDLGVYDSTAKKWLTRVASGPATGQYSVASGVYTFAAADTLHAVLLNYTYASTSTGLTVTVTNQLVGIQPVFLLYLTNQFTGNDGKTRSLEMKFNSVRAAKLAMPLKMDDFMLPSFDMTAGDDGTGNVFSYTMTG